MKWLITSVVVVLLVVGVALLMVGTTTGTRWLIDRARPDAVALTNVEGTLLTGVTIGALHVRLAESTVDVVALEVVPAWPASVVHNRLVFERVMAQALTVTTNGAPLPSPKPFALELPVLPIKVEIEILGIQRLVLPQLAADYVPAVNGQLAFDGVRYVLQSVDVQAHAYRLQGDAAISAERDLPVSGSIRWQLNDPTGAGQIEVAGSLRELQVTADLTQPNAAHVRGRVWLLGKVEPEFDLAMEMSEWHDVQYRLSGLNVAAAGTLRQFVAHGRADVRVADAETLSAEAAVAGSLDAVDVTALTLVSAHGHARATGRIERTPQPRIQLAVDIVGFDPSGLRSEISGALSGHVDVVWQEQQLALAIESLAGTLNGAPFNAAGTLRDTAGLWTSDGIDVRSGPNHAHAVVRWDGEKIDAHGTFAMPDLRTLMPDLNGDLNGTFVIAGTPEAPAIKAQAKAQSLKYADWEVSDARADINISGGKNGRARLDVAELRYRGSTLTDLSADARGSRSNIDATLGWTFADQRGSVVLSARSVADDWDLVVGDGAVLTLPGEVWRLDRRVTGRAGRNTLSLSAHCWLRGEGAGRVCVDTTEWRGGTVRLVGQLNELPANELNKFVEGLPELAGSASGRWNLTAERQRWSGTATLETANLSVVDRSDAAAIHFIELPRLTLAATLQNNRTTIAVQAVRDELRVLDMDVTIDGFDATSDIRGRAEVRFDDVSGLATLNRRVGALEGAVRGTIDIGGALGAPAVSGNIAMRDGRLMLQDPHIELTAVDVSVAMADLSQLTVRGAAKSKDGSVEINGTLRDPFESQRRFLAQIVATRVPIDIPDANVEVGGRVDFEWTQGLMSVKGTVEIPRAEITISALPEGAVAVSNDVVVIDRVEQRAGGTRLLVDLELILRDEVHFKAYGLATNLDGQLRLRQSADGLVQLTGTVALVNGTFTAYGQTLAIESGRLTYSGPPDDPFVDARATRTIKGVGADIVVGAHIQGPARNLQTTLYSDPEMSEAQTLAYLVLGRPLSGASAQETNNVMGAAIALGLTGAAPVIKEIRDVVGIDELTATGGSTEDLALIAGKRLNERVFVRYQYQTFTRTGAVLIELLLSRRLSLQATAAQAPAIDVIYRVGDR